MRLCLLGYSLEEAVGHVPLEIGPYRPQKARSRAPRQPEMTEAGLGTAQRLRPRPGFLPFFPLCSCKCHPWGSLEDQCHPKTGQCPCRPGVEEPDL